MDHGAEVEVVVVDAGDHLGAELRMGVEGVQRGLLEEGDGDGVVQRGFGAGIGEVVLERHDVEAGLTRHARP
jgi:hypothetical protein